MCELYKKYMPVTTICREAVDFVMYITYNEEGEPMIETNLAQTVDATNNSGSAYDTNIKYLLADKQILSHIMIMKRSFLSWRLLFAFRKEQ